MAIKYRNLDPTLQLMVDQGRYGSALERGANVDPWYVDLNRKQQGGGRSWDDAFNTYAAAFVAANAWFGVSNNRAWAKRGTIYCCSDGETENITTLPRRTDVIGVGTDVGTFPKITGVHTVAAAPSGNGVRLINMGFVHSAGTAPILTLPASIHGIELHHIRLYKAEGAVPTAGLQMTTTRDFVLNDVSIFPDAGADLCTIGLSIAGTTSGVGRAEILNSFICGDEGFDVADTSATYEGAICKNTVFKATNLAVDENSDTIVFVDCRFVTAAAAGDANGVGIVDILPANMVACEAVSSDSWGPIPNLNALS